MAFRENAPDSLARYGHDIHKQQVSGNATVHNGDINYVNATHEAVQNLLPRADGAQINSWLKEHEPSCLPGTRIEVLQYIKTWAEDGSDKRCVFWLSGMAGTGKSTIARTVARERLAQNQLGASFFFSKGGGDVGNARKFFTTIAFQLIQRSPALKAGILKIVKETLDIGTLPLREQWELLILRPLALLRPELHQQPLLLVVDALDECEDEQHVQLILQLLASANTHIRTVQLRVLVTSRPDTPIRLGFGEENPGIWHRDLVLNAVPRETVDHDITIYFSDQLKNIISSQDAHIIVRLVEKANGLFIWAATVCRYVKSGKRFANTRLSTILEKGMTALSPEKELDHIYTMILSDSIRGDFEKDEKEMLFGDFRNVVGAIVILFDPLSASALASLLRISEQDVKDVLDDLHSVLDVPASSVAPIRLLHPSFRDFLLSDKRCQETQLQVDERHVHRTLVYHCLGVMSSSLRRDIGGLKRPGSLVSDFWRNRTNQCIRPELEYACLYWVQHLQKSDILLQDQVEVHQFLRLHLLHWLEALAWLRRTSEAILALITLEGQIQADKGPRLHEIVRDAKRFAVYNRQIIEEAPLQLYCSALIFAPENSIIRRQFHQDIPGWILTKPKVQLFWDAALQTLEGHFGRVYSVAFSPDSRSVVSGSGDRMVRLWDVATGAPLQTLEGHFGRVYSVAFSPDSRSVVSGSGDRMVRLWDVATGAPLQTLEGHSGRVYSVAFSPDSRSVVSRSSDQTVRLWEAAWGAPLQTLDGHSGWVWSVAFAPDGRSVVSGSDDVTLRLWDVATGAPLQTLEGHSGRVTSVAFSPDGRSVVSRSSDQTVRLWEAAWGAPLQTLDGHSGWVWSVAFAPDGRSVVSGSDDVTLRLWDAATGATVRLWDAATGTPLQTLGGHYASVKSVAFSPDGRSVVSRSSDQTVRLWDAATGAPLRTLENYSGGVDSVAFSRNGMVDDTLLLSGNWLMEGEQKLIWLHPHHRGDLNGAHNGTVVLAQSSGRILILRFRSGPKVV